ncbi:MAG: helix-turn-helix domain-containing protein [Pirellulaceae bacterium]|nr:helix-turn-helix domain-containing protein [Pirellulaceae bacterium]
MDIDATANPETLLLSTREAARRLSISERTLWTLTDRGEIRCIRMGTAKRYPIIELERFIERKLLEQIDPLANSSTNNNKFPNLHNAT